MKFSVIIPCYNVEKYIENTVKTVLNQTYKDFEIILIDDGSKDSTLAILNNLKETDDRIKVFTQPNKGVSYTRNRGIDIAKGEYIYFLDADDEIKNILFEEADKVLIKKSIVVFSFGYKVIKDTKERMYIANKEFEGLYTSKEFLKKYFKLEIPQSICSLIVRRDSLKNIKFNEKLKIGEDLDFQIRVILLNNEKEIYYTSDIYFYYIMRKNSAMTSKKFNIRNLDMLHYLDKLRKKILEDQLYEFKEYQIIRFFSTIKDISNRDTSKEDYKLLKNEILKYDYVLKDLQFSFSKRYIFLLILKSLYKCNLKIFLYLLKLKNISNKYT